MKGSIGLASLGLVLAAAAAAAAAAAPEHPDLDRLGEVLKTVQQTPKPAARPEVKVSIDPLAQEVLNRIGARHDREAGVLRLPEAGTYKALSYKLPGTALMEVVKFGEEALMVRVVDEDGSQTIGYYRNKRLEPLIALKPGERVPVDVVIEPDAEAVMAANEMKAKDGRLILGRQPNAKIEYGLPGTKQVVFKKTGPAGVVMQVIDDNGDQGFMTFEKGLFVKQDFQPAPVKERTGR